MKLTLRNTHQVHILGHSKHRIKAEIPCSSRTMITGTIKLLNADTRLMNKDTPWYNLKTEDLTG